MATVNSPELCRTRFARLTIIAANIFSKMLREIALKNVQPEVTYIMIKTNPALYGILNADEKSILETLNSEKYNLCDAGLLYKILRHILPEPTNGWGKKPGFNNFTITDDIERVRLLRNKIFHRPLADITELEEWDTIKDVLEIADRIDQYLKKKSNEGFKKEVTDLSSCSLDPKLEEENVKLGLEVESLKRKETITEGGMTMHLTTGKKLEVFLADVLLRVPKPTEIDLVAEIKGFTDDDNKRIVEYLNKNDEKFNDQSRIIIIKKAEIGSVIIYLTLAAIQTEQQIHMDIYTFVQRLFAGIYSQIKSSTDNGAATDIMIFPNELTQSDLKAHGRDDGKIWQEESHIEGSLLIRLGVKMKLIKNENDLTRHTTNFMKNILSDSNSSHGKPRHCKEIEVILTPAEQGNFI
ncbi:unnamed protein product [Mytilus coruscus]|uniref:DZIP3-like HEPN domain-containing protein n=1 Tax=Mytilus coruscus TaxID=42192 RepID=A0A6J8CPC1_MYTCO|nr:unnamed protein product [Mytilus coruscus]